MAAASKEKRIILIMMLSWTEMSTFNYQNIVPSSSLMWFVRVARDLCLPFLFWHVISLLRFDWCSIYWIQDDPDPKKSRNILTFLRIDLDRPGCPRMRGLKSVQIWSDPMKWKPAFRKDLGSWNGEFAISERFARTRICCILSNSLYL